MLDLKKYGMDVEDLMTSVITEDLVCLANIQRKNSCDTKITNIINNTTIKIGGDYKIDGQYAVAGTDIVKILKATKQDDDTTLLELEKGQFGVAGGYTIGSHFRTVIVVDDKSDIKLTAWEFTDTTGAVNSNLFPVELGSGTISLKSELNLWSPLSNIQKYKVRNRKSIAYIFKGMNGRKFLKFSTVINRVRFNTRGVREPNKIVLDIKTKLSQWYDKDIVINKQLKGTTPKEFFKLVFSLDDNEVYYAQGVKEDSFPKINNLHTKEYNTISELLKAYCQNGIRFIFDREEKLKIFGDFNVDDIVSGRTLEFDITNSMLTEDEQMIFNTINTQSFQRQTLFNFEDLDNQYVKFFKVKRNVVNSNQMITVESNGDYLVNTISITDADLRSSVQLKDYVLFKRTVAPFQEFYGRVMALESGNTVVIMPILYDKDYKLFNYGKGKFLYSLLVVQSCPMDLHYVKKELPIIWKLSRNKGNETVDSSLMLPILPRVDGETLYKSEYDCKFGSASNLKIGSYTEIVEEVDKIYGTWDKSKLLYNMELEQFANKNYPPIFMLSNKVNERDIGNGNTLLNYTHFDNSDILLEVNRPRDNSHDATIIISNTASVSKDIDLYVDKELGRFGNKVLQVESLTPYSVGDVLIVNKPEDLTPQEETEFDELLSTIRWTITHKESVYNEETKEEKNYIYVDTPFAKRQKPGTAYEFTRFPNTSVVFVQELYFRGNPVIEFAQDIIGYSKGTTLDGDTSKELYGEKSYELDSKQLNKENLKLLMGYILEHFQAVTPATTKFNAPLSVYNALDLEVLDVIRINDPVYTQIKDDIQWVVTEIRAKGGTNVVELKLLNVNATNTKPYKIDIKDVIEYSPVDIPTYDHAGGEGSGDENNDGTGGTDIDKSLGQFWLAEVPSDKFRARVDRFESNYIYFKDFNGTEYEQYLSKLFPVDEFAVNIKGEVIFVQSDSNYRAFIKKRRVYDTEEVVIAPEDDVTFLVTTTYVDIDGTFFGRKVMLGDGDNYLSVDPIKGVKIVGDFVVGENNRHEGNDLWQSLQKNRTFQQPDQPVSTPQYVLREGDIWYDIDDENHAYRYDGKVWISARDGSIVSTQNNVFIQPDEPVDKDGRPLINGDTWYDSDDGMKPYIYQDGKWVNVTDMTLQEAIDKVEQQANDSTEKLKDMASDNKLTPSEKKQVELEINQIKIEYPKYTVEGEKFGITTVSYSDSYKALMAYISPLISDIENTSDIVRTLFTGYFSDYYKYRQELINAISSKAKELADKAQADATVALGNAKIFYQTEPPTEGMKENDLWYDTNDQNHPHIYKNGEWVSARDKIFETEGGNKVYFQSSQPPSSGYGIKEGDMWFDTAHNNTQYVLLKQDNGSLKWVLASDALDKINTGRIVLNGNTTINGDFVVRGRNIELTGDTKVNGILEVFSNDEGIISYNGTSESNSTKRIIIKGGEILFQEKTM